MTPTPTSGAADLPEALRRSTAADGKTELFNLPGYPLMVRAVDFNRIHAESEMRRAALLDEMQKAALAAGQATAAQQGGAYAALPDEVVRLAQVAIRECQYKGNDMPQDWMESAMRACRLIAASHGQAPATQQAVGNSGFDYKTAADFLSGKTVSDEALRKFVAASRGAHDARAALHAKMLSLQGELASREAEIALLKRSLLDAEADAAAPQHSTTAQSADSVPAVSDLPPLPAPDLRDVGTKPQEIKEFLKGYATEYARTAIAARAPAGAEESRTIPDREIPGIVEKALQELEGLVKYATSIYGHWDMSRAKGALSDLEWWARRKLAAHAQAADSVQEDAARESEYRRGYRHGYEQRDAEVRGAMA